MAKSFEELIIWQDARVFAKVVHLTFYDLIDFNFKDQINRASVSVMNNIAEGFERYSKADFKRFLQIAKASNGEVRSMTYLAEDYNYVTTEKAIEIRNLSLKIKTGIVSLINTLEK
jgi:four helix bundle protein